MSWLHLLFGFGGFAVELPEDLTERDQRDDREEQLRDQLRIGDTVGREEAVEQNEQRDLQHDLAQQGEQQRTAAHAAGVEDAADDQDVDGEERQPEAETAQIVRAVFDDRIVFDEQADLCPQGRPSGRSHGGHRPGL